MSTNQRAVMLCGWGIKAGMTCLQVKLCVAVSERFRKCTLKGALQISRFTRYTFYLLLLETPSRGRTRCYILIYSFQSGLLSVHRPARHRRCFRHRHRHRHRHTCGVNNSNELAATLWWFTAAPKPLKIQVFWVTQPPWVAQPLYTRGHN